MKNVFFLIIVFSLLGLSCFDGGNTPKKYTPSADSVTSIDDSLYVNTGFYFLSDADNAIKMLKVHSNETYAINRRPVVSVNDVVDVKLERYNSHGNTYTELCLTMNDDGAKALIDLTANPEYPYVAAVVTNHLLFVVQNNSKVTSGKMCVALLDFSEEEIQAMVTAVKRKM